MVVAMTIVLVALMLAMAVLPVVAYKKGVEFGISQGIDELVKKERKPTVKEKIENHKAKKIINEYNNSKEVERFTKIMDNIDRYDGTSKGQVKI